MFDYYASQGPLFVIIHRKVKYQYWFDRENPYNFQFMDAQDESVDTIKLPFFARLRPIMVKLSPHIMWNPTPTEQEQMAAVRQDLGSIEYIKNPSEAVQLDAVRQNGRAIQYIKNPSEAVQLAAVQQDVWAIYHITNSSEAVQLAAVRQNGRAIQYIKNPSEAVQLAAVQQDRWLIQYINNPTPKVLALAKQLRQTK
jgi:hypothetical protein